MLLGWHQGIIWVQLLDWEEKRSRKRRVLHTGAFRGTEEEEGHVGSVGRQNENMGMVSGAYAPPRTSEMGWDKNLQQE